MYVNKDFILAQWSTLPPEQQKIRVQILLGCKFFYENSNAVLYMYIAYVGYNEK
jgi:hypothetical protein